jgi:hypothetical protein
MSLFEMTAGSRYVKVVFDSRELDAIRAACSSASEKEYDRISDMTAAELEQAARQAWKATEFDIAGKLVEMFRPGQAILIEREDLAPVLASLEAYEPDVPEEHAAALKSALEKIRQSMA